MVLRLWRWLVSLLADSIGLVGQCGSSIEGIFRISGFQFWRIRVAQSCFNFGGFGWLSYVRFHLETLLNESNTIGFTLVEFGWFRRLFSASLEVMGFIDCVRLTL